MSSTAHQNLWNLNAYFVGILILIFHSISGKSVENVKFCLLPETASAMLNTTSQPLTVRRTGPKAVRVQNTERIVTCERAQLLFLTFYYAKRKP